VTGTEVTLSRPAWSTGTAFVHITVTMGYSTDATAAIVLTNLAYRMNATGSWLFLAEEYCSTVYMEGSQAGQVQTTYTLEIAAGDYVQVAAGGRQTAGAGTVTVDSAALNGFSMWAA
jgi:hypothetical protein